MNMTNPKSFFHISVKFNHSKSEASSLGGIVPCQWDKMEQSLANQSCEMTCFSAYMPNV